MKIRFRSLDELQEAIASGRFAGRAVHMVVLHDDSCTPHLCTCSPEFVVEDLTVENYKRGQRAQAAWRKGATS